MKMNKTLLGIYETILNKKEKKRNPLIWEKLQI